MIEWLNGSEWLINVHFANPYYRFVIIPLMKRNRHKVLLLSHYRNPIVKVSSNHTNSMLWSECVSDHSAVFFFAHLEAEKE